MPLLSVNRPAYANEIAVFEPLPKSSFQFILWNLYLTDKLTPIRYEDLLCNGIREIVAILPEEEDFLALEPEIRDIPYAVLPYHNTHEPYLPKEEYDRICKKIDDIAKGPREQPRNILVFCNNGYQRSLPFLVYYMTRFHADECSSIGEALRLILMSLGTYKGPDQVYQLYLDMKKVLD